MPAPTPSVTVAPAPLFESDEEALAAAEEVYREYLAVSDLIAREGGADPERLRELVTEEQFERDRAYFDQVRADGYRFEGGVVLAQVDLQTATRSEVILYGCLDVSAVRRIDSDGRDVSELTRPSRVLVEVLLVVDRDKLVIGGLQPWSTSC